MFKFIETMKKERFEKEAVKRLYESKCRPYYYKDFEDVKKAYDEIENELKVLNIENYDLYVENTILLNLKTRKEFLGYTISLLYI